MTTVKVNNDVSSIKWAAQTFDELCFGFMSLLLFTVGISSLSGVVFAESLAQSNLGSEIPSDRFGHIWAAPIGDDAEKDAEVFFTFSRNKNNVQLFRSTKTSTQLAPTLQSASGQPVRVVGVTDSYLYLQSPVDNSISRRVELWRMHLNGDPATLTRVKRIYIQSDCHQVALSRAENDIFIAVVNVHSMSGSKCLPETKGVKAYRIRDSEDRMVNIGNGGPSNYDQLPLRRYTTHVHSPGVGEILSGRLLLFTTKRRPRARRASATGVYSLRLDRNDPFGWYNFPAINSRIGYTVGTSDLKNVAKRPNEFGSTYSNTAKGSVYLYTRVDGRIGEGCELWRMGSSSNNNDTNARRLSQLNTLYGDDQCLPEMAIVDGNRLIFKKINFGNKTIELWETRGYFTARKIHSWPVPTLRALGSGMSEEEYNKIGFINLQVIGNRIWFVKANPNGSSEIWRSSSLIDNSRPRFGRVHRRNNPLSIHKAGNEVLVVDKHLYRYEIDGPTRTLRPIAPGNGLVSNIAVVDDEAVFAFQMNHFRVDIISLDLNTGESRRRRSIRLN